MKKRDEPWRILARKIGKKGKSCDVALENEGAFDELVVGEWFHIENMAPRSYWMRVGDHDFGISISKNGKVKVIHYELGNMDHLVKDAKAKK